MYFLERKSSYERSGEELKKQQSRKHMAAPKLGCGGAAGAERPSPASFSLDDTYRQDLGVDRAAAWGE